MRIHTELKQCKCDSCGAAFRTVQSVVEHKMIAHVDTGAYKCSNCSCQFENRRSCARHMGSRHPFQQLEESLLR
jgi:uncharacterized C2H2 Zn-finger protein